MIAKPKIQPNSKFRQGLFKPKNPEKYIGNVNDLRFRSGLEYRYMKYFDENPAILNWASEEMTVDYVSPADGKKHRYYPDFLLKIRDIDGNIKYYMIEIKPLSQTKEPTIGKNKKRYITEKLTYEVNQAKWKAADSYCNSHDMKFIVFTENSIKFK